VSLQLIGVGKRQCRVLIADDYLGVEKRHCHVLHFPIYARLGVPEIWCYDSGELKIYQLEGKEYIEVQISSIFPTLPIQEIPKLIEKHRYSGRLSLRKAVREWATEKSTVDNKRLYKV
jgi:hypothetical protein